MPGIRSMVTLVRLRGTWEKEREEQRDIGNRKRKEEEKRNRNWRKSKRKRKRKRKRDIPINKEGLQITSGVIHFKIQSLISIDRCIKEILIANQSPLSLFSLCLDLLP
jgi:hypothetical protein